MALLQMNKLLLSLLTLWVVSVTTVSHAAEVKGSAVSGETKVSLCIGCHGIEGYQASFPEVHRVPKISGQNAKYLAASLLAYKNGDRKHPTMAGVATTLSEQDIADMAAFYGSHRVLGVVGSSAEPPQASAKVLELVEKGACTSCHGEGFNKPLDGTYPKISGQHADYLFVALKSYKGEKRAVVGRNNAVMTGVVKQFSNAELKVLADYIGKLPGDLKTIPQNRFR